MRAVVSSGMAAALEQLGLRDSFDAVYGVSAGASIGAYFVAGQVTEGTAIFFEHANSPAFIDLRRILVGRPIVDAGFIFERVMRDRIPLDFAAIQRSGIQLRLVAALIDRPVSAPAAGPRAVAFSEFSDLDDLFAALYASSRIPFLSGLSPYTYRGRRFWDAALVEPVPIDTALADGCTHVLALLSLPRGTPARPVHVIDRALAAWYMRRLGRAVEDAYRNRYSRRADLCSRLLERGQASPESPFVEAVVLPAGSPEVRQHEMRATVLRAGARAGARAVLSALDVPADRAAGVMAVVAPP